MKLRSLLIIETYSMKCPTCNMAGEVPSKRNPKVMVTCPRCGGEGKIYPKDDTPKLSKSEHREKERKSLQRLVQALNRGDEIPALGMWERAMSKLAPMEFEALNVLGIKHEKEIASAKKRIADKIRSRIDKG